jgi:hypothetical protein
MAGTIIADYIRTDANRLSLNVGNTVVASINASGILNNAGGVILNANGTFASGVTLPTSSLVGTIGTSQIANNSVSRAKIGYAGAILQVVQAVKTDSYAAGAGAQWLTIPGLSASITPTSTSSRILVLLDVKYIGDTDASISRIRMMRDSTPIYLGDAAGSRPRTSGAQNYNTSGGSGGYNVLASGGVFLDSPSSTSSITYAVQIGGDGNVQTLFVNRTESDRDNSYYDSRTASSITLMEIAG